MLRDKNSRRDFIKTSAKTLILTGIGASVITDAMASSGSGSEDYPSGDPFTGFAQQPLPYSYEALEDIIDAKTMEIHYTKHAAAYSKNLQEAAKAEGVDTSKPLEDVLKNISKYTMKMRNNGGGHYNHEMFWQCMRPKTANNKPQGKLLQAIENNFTSFESFKTQFSDAGKGRFGSGWAWLYYTGKKDKHPELKIGSTPNQDNPLMDVSDIKGTPLLGLDVWEHAYYLKYQNKRADYIENWWNLVNWDHVEKRFQII